MSGAETARRRVVQRLIGSAESAAPKRRRRNVPPPLQRARGSMLSPCDDNMPPQARKKAADSQTHIALKATHFLILQSRRIHTFNTDNEIFVNEKIKNLDILLSTTI